MGENERERAIAYWLCSISGIGDATIRKLLKVCDSPVGIYQASEQMLAQILSTKQLESLMRSKAQWKPEENYEKLERQKISFLLQEDADYPRRLRYIPDPPFALFVKGTLPREDVLSVAVIGARECSEYGKFVAKGLGRTLGECGISVISGMARGIDSISQMAALEAGGVSFGVLGCGVDICYPGGNRTLYEQLQTTGGILSTYVPGTQPRPQNFPPRNRIVSGLADVVVVVEARSKSGTLITVDMALEQGKEVYVVPGRITDRLSDGCNQLLKQGAGIILSPDAFVEEIGGVRRTGKEIFRKKPDTADSNVGERQSANLQAGKPGGKQRVIYQALELTPQSLEEISRRTGEVYSVIEISTALMELCMMQMAVQVTPGHFRKS